MILRRLLLAGTLLLAGAVSAKKSDGPEITATKFDNQPINLFYFEDSDTVLFQETHAGIIHRTQDAGKTWKPVDGPNGDMKGKVLGLMPHPHDKKTAYAVGQEQTHWITEDAGESWRAFSMDKALSAKDPFAFHGTDSNKVIALAEECLGFVCETFSYYTTDGFKTVNRLLGGQRSCTWAVSTPLFGDGIELASGVDDRIYCIVPGLHSPLISDFRLIYSDKFFREERASEAPLNDGRAVSGVVHMAGVKKFLLAAATWERTDELALYVTRDAVHWHRAEFGGHKIEEDAYTVLESTNYSVQVGVLTNTGPSPMGVLFTSNSNGTYYTRNAEHLNFDKYSTVDFEKVAGIQGIFLVNTVDNWEAIENRRETDKKIISRITFDDGRTFKPLKVGDLDLHLHSVTELTNSGRVFSSPAPGLVMGIGNTGDYLKDYADGDLFVSDNAGITWSKGLEEAHKYEFGDQGSILVAVFDEGKTDKISYSIDHGKHWESKELRQNIRAKQLTTTPDSTSLRFLLVGSPKKSSDGDHYMISIDFSNMHERKCEKGDFKRWPARLNEQKEPDCLMGHKQFYNRRAADADCFIGDTTFQDPVPEVKRCKCTEEDFECDFNYIRSEDGKSCLPSAGVSVPEGECKKPEDEYTGFSGFRLIPGNDCERDGGVELDKEITRPCNDTSKSPVASGKIAVEKTYFKTEKISQYLYLEHTETIILLTRNQEVYITKDHGKTWKQVLEDKNIITMRPHKYHNDAVFLITATKKVYYTYDRGDSFHEFEVKLPPSKDNPDMISFHPQNRDWLIWIGADCEGTNGCHTTASYSTTRGDEWHTLARDVEKCEFLGMEGRAESDKLVLCAQYEQENPDKHLQLVSSDDWFAKSNVHFDSILKFATAAEFIVVAARAEDQKSLKLDTSVDGKTYADAQFPSNFHVEVQQEYTVLPTTTHAIFLHVTVNRMQDHEYGSILKSNSNGTSYVLSASGVNRNTLGYADFERMEGLEGVELINIVANIDETNEGAPKKLRSMITHNDGSEWALIDPPKEDAEGRGYECGGKRGATEDCALHLHSYTERRDYRDTFSSASAIGLMIANGNVGDHLTQKSEANTYITRDGGITWNEIKKGNYMWEYGDQGSVIVIVAESKATTEIFYTLDEGEKWQVYKFTDVEMQIDDISTVPSDTSLNFLLWGKEVGGEGAKSGVVTVNLDFSGLEERQNKCVLREDDPEADDYYLWQPKHPLQDHDCLFGHAVRYHRKLPEKQCYNGKETRHIDHIGANCECTWQDYECDYNYERQTDGSCQLVSGLEPADPQQVCRDDPEAVEYYEPTGYRRIPMTTCEGGLQLDHITPHPCPNKEKEFEKKHPGLSGVGIFFTVIFSIGLASAAGYYAYTHWGSKLGHIRLGETGSGSFFSRDSSWTSIPVNIVAGTVAVLSAIPLLVSSLWRSARGYVRVPGRSIPRPYATRGSFAARRGDYTGVAEDEDELLGADEFEDGDDDEEV